MLQGGEHRVCLINDETFPRPDTMRKTGDRVIRDNDGRLWYQGRTDHQIKRWGKRVNLEQIELVRKDKRVTFSQFLWLSIPPCCSLYGVVRLAQCRNFSVHKETPVRTGFRYPLERFQ